MAAMTAVMAYYGHDNEIQLGIVGFIGALPTVGLIIASIKEKIKARKYERKAKTMELKMKMTDTPYEIKMDENEQ
jgi:hypothetical protein